MNESFSHQPEQVPAAPEAIRKSELLTAEDIEAQADYISMTIAKHENPVEGRREAYQAYIEEEPNPDLQKFGKLLLLAPIAAEQQKNIDAFRAQERAGGLGGDQYQRLRKAVRTSCAYNQMIGSFVEEHEAQVSRDKLTGWLERASGSNRAWAEQVTAGVAAEIAAHKVLTKVPALQGVEHGDLDQDLKGQDYVFAKTSSGDESLDVKTGAHRPTMPVTRDKTGRLVLSLNPEHISGFEVKEQFVSGYVEELTNKLT